MPISSHEQTYQPNRPTQYNQLDEADYFLARGLAGRALVIYESVTTAHSGSYANSATSCTEEPIDFDGIRHRRNAGIKHCQIALGAR